MSGPIAGLSSVKQMGLDSPPEAPPNTTGVQSLAVGLRSGGAPMGARDKEAPAERARGWGPRVSEAHLEMV